MYKPSIIEQSGYCWLQLPRESILPLALLESDNSSVFRRFLRKVVSAPESAKEVIGSDIFSLFPRKGSGQVPGIDKPQITALFKGHDLIALESSVSIAGNFPLIEETEVTMDLKKASKLLYSFKDVKQIQLNSLILLEEYLNLTKHTTHAPGFLNKLKNNKIYVVTEVLQTNEFNIKYASDFVLDSQIDVNMVQEYVALKTKVNVASADENVLSYSNTVPITFALKAALIIYNQKEDNFTVSQKPLKLVRGEVDVDCKFLTYEDLS